MLIIKDGQPRVIARSKALGQKEVVIEEDINCGDEVDLVVEDGKMVFKKKPASDIADDVIDYTFITNEIGLFGYKKGFKSAISVRFCDNMMIVDLIKGAIAIRPENEVLQATKGVEPSQVPPCNTSEILWVDVEKLLPYIKNWGKYAGKYPLDYEYYLEIGGDCISNLTSFSVKKAMDSRDISLGALAIVEDSDNKKADAKEAGKMAKMMMSAGNASVDFADDDDESDEDDEDDDEYTGTY